MAQRDLQIGTWVTQTAASPASMKTSTDVPKKKNLLLPKGLFVVMSLSITKSYVNININSLVIDILVLQCM